MLKHLCRSTILSSWQMCHFWNQKSSLLPCSNMYKTVFAIKYTYNLLNYRLKSVKHKLEVKGWILLQWVSIKTDINQWIKQNYTIKLIEKLQCLNSWAITKMCLRALDDDLNWLSTKETIPMAMGLIRVSFLRCSIVLIINKQETGLHH